MWEGWKGKSPLAVAILKLLPLHWIAQPPSLEADLVAELPQAGLKGVAPLTWWAAGLYGGQLRRQLLHLRTSPSRPLVGALIGGLVAGLRQEPWVTPPLLVPIPSWKRQANPLPALLTSCLTWELDWRQSPLLVRSRPVLGQHHLGRELRWANQAGAFRCASALAGQRRPVLLVDDILTTGATACAAAAALGQRGWQVAGMVCLGKTPRRDRDLGSSRCGSGGPG